VKIAIGFSHYPFGCKFNPLFRLITGMGREERKENPRCFIFMPFLGWLE
jgi:hypothetical protein